MDVSSTFIFISRKVTFCRTVVSRDMFKLYFLEYWLLWNNSQLFIEVDKDRVLPEDKAGVEHIGSISVSGQLHTHPSPNPTCCNK